MENKIRVTLEKGVIATPENHKITVANLGLRHRHASRIFKETPALLGMIHQVSYLLKVEKVTDEISPTGLWGDTPEYELGPIPPEVLSGSSKPTAKATSKKVAKK